MTMTKTVPTWAELEGTLPEGLSPATRETIKKATAPERHRARVDATIAAAQAGADAAWARVDVKPTQEQRAGLTCMLVTLDLSGPRWRAALGGPGTTMRMSWASGLGKGRWLATDGDAYRAAAEEAERALREAYFRPAADEDIVGPARFRSLSPPGVIGYDEAEEPEWFFRLMGDDYLWLVAHAQRHIAALAQSEHIARDEERASVMRADRILRGPTPTVGDNVEWVTERARWKRGKVIEDDGSDYHRFHVVFDDDGQHEVGSADDVRLIKRGRLEPGDVVRLVDGKLAEVRRVDTYYQYVQVRDGDASSVTEGAVLTSVDPRSVRIVHRAAAASADAVALILDMSVGGIEEVHGATHGWTVGQWAAWLIPESRELKVGCKKMPLARWRAELPEIALVRGVIGRELTAAWIVLERAEALCDAFHAARDGVTGAAADIVTTIDLPDGLLGEWTIGPWLIRLDEDGTVRVRTDPTAPMDLAASWTELGPLGQWCERLSALAQGDGSVSARHLAAALLVGERAEAIWREWEESAEVDASTTTAAGGAK